MKDDRPSFTAAWVAGCRGLGELLPEDAQLAHDPFGLAFASPWFDGLAHIARSAPALARHVLPYTGALVRGVVWLQVRTRVLDDVLRAFVRDGGRQVVLLGAGFDARAARLHELLSDSVVFEVDHPATQGRKREVLARAGARVGRVEYLPWNFEYERMNDLPGRLASAGHDPSQTTLTIWEGVTMYLTVDAIEATVRAVATYSSVDSQFAITYFDRKKIRSRTGPGRIAAAAVRALGEPWLFGWEPEQIGRWLSERGFELRSNDSGEALAQRLLPAHRRLPAGHRGGHIAVALRSGARP